MLLSIIVPVYNSKKSVRNCLDSILSQTSVNFEVIIIDDGSTDGTSEIVDDYSEKYSRVHAYHFANAGVSSARQKGIALSSGEYVIFVDSDDSIQPQLVERVEQAITSYNFPDIVRYQANLLNDAPYKDHNRHNFFDPKKVELSGMNALKAWSVQGKKYALYWLYAFKKTVFSNVFGFPDLRCYEDVALIPLLIASSHRVVTINYVGYNYTCNNPESLTNSKNESAEENRAIDFVNACNFATTNFKRIDGISPLDLAFFVEDYNRRLKGKFNSLSDELKEKLADLF